MARAASARVWVTTTSTRWVSVWVALRAPVVASVAPAVALAWLSAAAFCWAATRQLLTSQPAKVSRPRTTSSATSFTTMAACLAGVRGTLTACPPAWF